MEEIVVAGNSPEAQNDAMENSSRCSSSHKKEPAAA